MTHTKHRPESVARYNYIWNNFGFITPTNLITFYCFCSQYHEDIDATRYCAQSRVYRFTFLMADHFCQRLGVQLVARKHLPQNIDMSRSILSLKSTSTVCESCITFLSVNALLNESFLFPIRHLVTKRIAKNNQIKMERSQLRFLTFDHHRLR